MASTIPRENKHKYDHHPESIAMALHEMDQGAARPAELDERDTYEAGGTQMWEMDGGGGR